MIEQVNNLDLLSFEFEKSIVDEKKVIGTFVKNTVTIELYNFENVYSNLKGTYIKTNMGTFYVDDILPAQEEIKIKLSCYDLSQKFDEEIDTNKFTFPTSLKTLKKRICETVGVECDEDDFPNSDFILTGMPYLEEHSTYRDLMKMVAQAGASYVFIDTDDVLKFGWFKDDVVNEFNDYFELNTEDNEIDEVNIVVLGRGDVEDNVVYPEIRPDNPKEIRIDSNEILDLDRKKMIVPIYNQVNGFKYTVFSLKTYGNLKAKVGQKIKYLDNDLKEHYSYIMNHTLTYSGDDYNNSSNWISKLEAVELDETNTNYRFAESIEEKTSRTERLADKLDGIISDVVESVSEYDSKISEMEQTVDKFSQKVENMIDPVRTVSGTTYVHLEEVVEGPLLRLSISNLRYIYPSSKTYPSTDLFPKGNVLIIDKERNLTDEAIRIELPYKNLYHYSDEIYDELVIERIMDEEGNARQTLSIIHRCKLDDSLEVQPLTQPTTETFDDVEINLFKDNTYIYMESFQKDVVKYEVKYATKNELEDVFATKLELNSAITQTKNEIDLSVEQTVEDMTTTDKLIAKINMKPGQILLEGTVTANENFKILTDGSIEAKNGSFSGNIYLQDGNKIIGGDGLFSNLQYISEGSFDNWDFIGFMPSGDGELDVLYKNLNLYAPIPQNFNITYAYLTLLTTSAYSFDSEHNSWTAGELQKLRLYVNNSGSAPSLYYTFGGEYFYNDNTISMTEIDSAFGEKDYTPQNQSVGGMSEAFSYDIKEYLIAGQLNTLTIKTMLPPPTIDDPISYIGGNNGLGKMILNVYGYMSFKEE